MSIKKINFFRILAFICGNVFKFTGFLGIFLLVVFLFWLFSSDIDIRRYSVGFMFGLITGISTVASSLFSALSLDKDTGILSIHCPNSQEADDHHGA